MSNSQMIRQQSDNNAVRIMSGTVGPGQTTVVDADQMPTLVVEQQTQHVTIDQPQQQTQSTTSATAFHAAAHVISAPAATGLHQRSASTGSDQFRTLIDQVSQPQSITSSQPTISQYSLADHVDDDNDLFECGKCKVHFNFLSSFLQHKKLCRKSYITNNEKLRRELAEIELHLGIASSSSQNMIQSGGSVGSHHQSIGGKTGLLSSSTNSSPLLIQSTNNSPTSMLVGGGHHHHQTTTNQLVVDVNNHRQHPLHQHHPNRSSPLGDPLNGSTINVNSILPDTDLLSLASSLDANMIASIGNSISPSSLLHLQGGDVSSNTDDFAQFAHLNHIVDGPTDASMNDVHQISSRTTATTTGGGNLVFGVHTSASNNNNHSMLMVSTSTTTASPPISVNSQQHAQHHNQASQQQHHHPPQPQPMNVINFMNTINPSPTSFTSFIQNLSSGETGTVAVIGGSSDAASPTSSLLKASSFDGGEGESTTGSNDNSMIGSPSRFLNLPLPTAPSSIIEHRPNQQQQQAASVRAIQNPNHQQTKTVTMNVIQQHNTTEKVVINGQNQSQTNNNSSVLTNQTTTETIFKCSYCDRSFHKSIELANHIPCHTGEKPYQCCICGKAFGQKNNLRKHIMTHRMSKEQYQTAYKTSVSESMKNMPNQTAVQLKQRQQKQQQQTATPAPQTENILSTTGTSTTNDTIFYICPLKCGYNTTNFDELKVHCANEHQTIPLITTEDKTKPTIIQQPPATTPDSNSAPPSITNPSQTSTLTIAQPCLIQIKQEILPSPTRTTTDHTVATVAPSTTAKFDVQQNKFTCPITGCGFISTKETEFKVHCVDHEFANNENIRFACTANDCKEVYNNIEAYIKHLQSHDRDKSESDQASAGASGEGSTTTAASGNTSSVAKTRLYRCQTCLNRYTTQNALENHKATTSHHYPCPQCNKVFPCERYLRRHLLTHGAGLFICNFCDKSFKTANYLKVHLIIHTGEKPFACKICDAAFNRRDKLKRHELVHDPIKRYKCPMNSNGCKREFNRPDKLKAHILTHSGVKPYQCSTCSRSFTRRAHLREHCKTHQEIVDAIIKANIEKVNVKKETTSAQQQQQQQQQLLTVKKEQDNSNNQEIQKASSIKNEDSAVQTMFDKGSSFISTCTSTMGSNSLPTQPAEEQPPTTATATISKTIKQAPTSDHSIILFTGPTPAPPPPTTSSTTTDTNLHQIMEASPSTTTTTSITSTTSVNLNTSHNRTTITNTKALSPGTTTTTPANNPLYIVLYSCPVCQEYSLKEDEITNHKCLAKNSTTTSISTVDEKNNNNNNQNQPILVTVTDTGQKPVTAPGSESCTNAPSSSVAASAPVVSMPVITMANNEQKAPSYTNQPSISGNGDNLPTLKNVHVKTEFVFE